jgi:hypothetical protein
MCFRAEHGRGVGRYSNVRIRGQHEPTGDNPI